MVSSLPCILLTTYHRSSCKTKWPYCWPLYYLQPTSGVPARQNGHIASHYTTYAYHFASRETKWPHYQPLLILLTTYHRSSRKTQWSHWCLLYFLQVPLFGHIRPQNRHVNTNYTTYNYRFFHSAGNVKRFCLFSCRVETVYLASLE